MVFPFRWMMFRMWIPALHEVHLARERQKEPLHVLDSLCTLLMSDYSVRGFSSGGWRWLFMSAMVFFSLVGIIPGKDRFCMNGLLVCVPGDEIVTKLIRFNF